MGKGKLPGKIPLRKNVLKFVYLVHREKFENPLPSFLRNFPCGYCRTHLSIHLLESHPK